MQRRLVSYNIKEVRPYINWIYLYHAWGVGATGKEGIEEEQRKLWEESQTVLDAWEKKYKTHAVVVLAEAASDGDDIVITIDDADDSVKADSERNRQSEASTIRLPMLRQQNAKGSDNQSNGDGATSSARNYCLADFIRPLSLGGGDTIGIFAATVDAEMEKGGLLEQTLADRLAEATVERLHEQVRRQWWGYAADEQLSIDEMLQDRFQGIRPAVGYPSMPDISINFLIDEVIGMHDIGISLTESGMMRPHASVSGLMVSLPQARYFNIGRIGTDQLHDYARRRGMTAEEMRRFIKES